MLNVEFLWWVGVGLLVIHILGLVMVDKFELKILEATSIVVVANFVVVE